MNVFNITYSKSNQIHRFARLSTDLEPKNHNKNRKKAVKHLINTLTQTDKNIPPQKKTTTQPRSSQQILHTNQLKNSLLLNVRPQNKIQTTGI